MGRKSNRHDKNCQSCPETKKDRPIHLYVSNRGTEVVCKTPDPIHATSYRPLATCKKCLKKSKPKGWKYGLSPSERSRISHRKLEDDLDKTFNTKGMRPKFHPFNP